jgi:serine protease Do
VRFFPVVIAVAASMACGSTVKGKKQTRLTPKEIVDRSKAAIVRIEVGNDRVGTGFVVDREGAIATNLHVVVGAADIKVRTLDGTVLTVPRVLALDPDHDLALIDVDPRQPLPVLALGDSDKVSAGDPVIAIGNPLGVLDYTVSDGLISSVRAVSPELTLLQISAPISQGSSGGPLFNSFGEVIGVATAIFNEGQNLNFGVPSNYVRKMSATRKPMTVAEFAELTRPRDPTIESGGKTIVRKVPRHDVSIFEGCTEKQVEEAVKSIGQAIELGAPLYNSGNHEACYRIYEGTSIRFERESGCKGVREAFGAGLLRSSTLESYTEKAWALRDMFDGLLEVAMRHAKSGGGGKPKK